jgi:aspartyl-tRNA(Asn)/glutamyl-tRNA(Gln) amidotransferase subunit B
VLVSDADAAALFEATLAADASLEAKPVANWVTGEYLRIRNAAAEPVVLGPSELAKLVRLVADGSISRGTGKDVLQAHLETGQPVEAIVEARGLRQISDTDALGSIVDGVIAANPDAVADVRAGKGQAIGFLVGQVMKATRGQANAAVAQAALRERLEQPEELT